ncbi:hypothetical protein [Actinokineospora globicatena]|uniref:Sporulation related domain-containing protein n=1 Tax=Actinokineospora globicatena TaxID=103729 RepID=A0A9W6V8P7_9PSEU|nr:hypothetical protein [Actinokineospora globicatena]MCP2300345.1 hypothetical protein [Actinokineospora globicatena]GLW80873.1 hypothetical protein Aglo01_53540 [Actinokineospora globicatena]GLW88066.1 hypothetical protein Aglo02_57050 [Actinokineospora globicatena]GLW92552.1 hypothetical protein Aglo03_33680 [Actinokineospora globicatena]
MADDPNPDPGWYYNTKTNQVEHGTRSRSVDLLGPYPDRATAERALDIARERTKAADKADQNWDRDED